MRWLAELNAEDKGTNLETAIHELNQIAENQFADSRIKSSSIFVQRFIYRIKQDELPKVKDYPELKAGLSNNTYIFQFIFDFNIFVISARKV